MKLDLGEPVDFYNFWGRLWDGTSASLRLHLSAEANYRIWISLCVTLEHSLWDSLCDSLCNNLEEDR